MQWLVLIWAIFVLAMYVGGYFYPAAIGIDTPDSGKIYSVFLLIGIAASVLRLMSARSGKAPGSAHAK